MMNQRERDNLDRWITGNYGEDQFRDEDNQCDGSGWKGAGPPILCEGCPACEQDEEEAREDALIRRAEERFEEEGHW